MDDIRGLVSINPTIGWGLMLGSIAILGMPPFGIFASEFLILTTAMRQHPWATPFLLLALGVAFAGIFSKVQPMVFGESDAQRLPHSPALTPVFVHLAMVLVLGVYIPPALAAWYSAAAHLIARVKMETDFTKYQQSPVPSNVSSHILRVDREQWLRTGTGDARIRCKISDAMGR